MGSYRNLVLAQRLGMAMLKLGANLTKNEWIIISLEDGREIRLKLYMMNNIKMPRNLEKYLKVKIDAPKTMSIKRAKDSET